MKTSDFEIIFYSQYSLVVDGLSMAATAKFSHSFYLSFNR